MIPYFNGTLVTCFDRRIWDLEDLFWRFDAEIVDAELISSLDKLLHERKIGEWNIDNILTALISKIRNDEVKSSSISEYIKRYTKIFERWDENSKKVEDSQTVLHKYQRLVDAYQILSKPDVHESYKYEAAFELSKNVEFIQRQNFIQPFVDVIAKFFTELNLDEMTLKKTSENSFSLSTFLKCWKKIELFL